MLWNKYTAMHGSASSSCPSRNTYLFKMTTVLRFRNTNVEWIYPPSIHDEILFALHLSYQHLCHLLHEVSLNLTDSICASKVFYLSYQIDTIVLHLPMQLPPIRLNYLRIRLKPIPALRTCPAYVKISKIVGCWINK